jgi:hypothetical protein
LGVKCDADGREHLRIARRMVGGLAQAPAIPGRNHPSHHLPAGLQRRSSRCRASAAIVGRGPGRIRHAFAKRAIIDQLA